MTMFNHNHTRQTDRATYVMQASNGTDQREDNFPQNGSYDIVSSGIIQEAPGGGSGTIRVLPTAEMLLIAQKNQAFWRDDRDD